MFKNIYTQCCGFYLFINFFGNGEKFLRFYFKDFSVKAEDSVGFVLNVGKLGVNCGAKSVLNRRNNFPLIKRADSGNKLLAAFEFFISVFLADVEAVTFRRKGVSAEFRENKGIFALSDLERLEIAMLAFNVAFAAFEPTGS